MSVQLFVPLQRRAEIITKAVFFARDMVSAPGNEMTPTAMAEEARKITARKNVKLRVLDERKLRKIGMNALLGVAKGSAEPARFIILEYQWRLKGRTHPLRSSEKD